MALEWTETLVSGENVLEALLKEYVWWLKVDKGQERPFKEQAAGAMMALRIVAEEIGIANLRERAAGRMTGGSES